MRVGHIIALVGALLVLLGGAVLDWQFFDLAQEPAKGYEIPLAGQAVLVLGALIALTSALGLVTRKRYQFAGATLVASVFALGWMIYAHAQFGGAALFELMEYEVVSMLPGYGLAVIGGVMMFVGPLVVLASEPAWDPKHQFLRVALLWKDTVVQEKVLQQAQTFTIGDDLRNDFIIPDDQLPKKFPLFRVGRKGTYDIGLTREMQGQITVNQQTEAIDDFIRKSTENISGVNYVPISLGDWGMLNLSADMRVFFQFIQPDQRGRRKGLIVADESLSASVLGSAFVQAALVVLAVLLWNIEGGAWDLSPEGRRDVSVEAHVLHEDIEEEIEEDGEEEEVAKAAEDEEGKFGDPEEMEESVVPHLDARMVDEIDPKNVGLLDILSTDQLDTGAIAEIMSATSEGLANKLAVAMGGEGSEFVLGHGAGGMGFTGDGTGGGGTGLGRIQGMGDIDTGGGPGIRAGMGKKAAKRVGKVDVGVGRAQGFCRQDHIASTVRRRAGAIRACYEQQLQVKRDLSGKLTARWTIELNGSVSNVSAVEDTIRDSNTTNCIFRLLRRLRFEKPDGGICIVQWPFVFNPG